LSKVTAKPLLNDGTLQGDLELTRTEYVPEDLVVTLQNLNTGVTRYLQFKAVIGIRVLDERDLLEYWPECSTPNGRLFEIISGGWLSQERTRTGSLIAATFPAAREFFVAATDACISVLCTDEPIVSENAP
jgi:hypothetical protein